MYSSKSEIIFAISNGDRDPVDDADEVVSGDHLGTVHFIHYAKRGSVNIDYEYSHATRCSETYAGNTAMYQFNITDNE